MKKIILFLVLCFFSFILVAYSQEADSTYSYSYNCIDCGSFETYSINPIDLSTTSIVSTVILEDTSTTTLAEFSFTSNRKSNINIVSKSRILFNVYPNPTSSKFYINFEIKDDISSNILILDMKGKVVFKKDYGLKSGLNVFEIPAVGFSNGLYLVKYVLKNQYGSKRILISR